MQPLIDADILLYEIGFSCQKKDNGLTIVKPWEDCQELFEKKIELICEDVKATKPPILYFTNTEFINKMLNKRRKWVGEEERAFTPNFREAIAVSRGYKSGRKEEKPAHFHNILMYAFDNYEVVVSEDGLEADDLMCIESTLRPDEVIVCSRDKDLRQCPGNFFSWECGAQRAIGPLVISPIGFLELIRENNDKGKPKAPKLFGVGAKWFYAQMLMGDSVDSIGGAKGSGPVGAYDLLHKLESERELYEAVKKVYQEKYKDGWLPYLQEQANLLYMIREIRDGQPVLFQPPACD